jgi:hypothetical protein
MAFIRSNIPSQSPEFRLDPRLVPREFRPVFDDLAEIARTPLRGLTPHERNTHIRNLINRENHPAWVKVLLRAALGVNASHHPTAMEAARTIHDFQRYELGGERLTAAQMQQMASTGYLTRLDGTTIEVDADVQAAAERFMDNHAELFKRVESAANGRHDGILCPNDFEAALKSGVLSGCQCRHLRITEFRAAQTIHDFQHTVLCGELLSTAQMHQMAATGYLTRRDGKTIALPQNVQNAARLMIADDDALFKKLESATTGRHDGLLGLADFHNAIADGTISVRMPIHLSAADFRAAKSIHDFQLTALQGEMLNTMQMRQMASTGFLTRQDGRTIPVPPEVRYAAQSMMADNAKLFRKIEAATTGCNDGVLSAHDFDNAVKSGTLCPPDPPRGNMSDLAAAQTIHDFQKSALRGEHLSATQMEQMARTGYLTRKDGATISVPPEVQSAARAMMAAEAALFKRIESATSGKRDGWLAPHDFDFALRNGLLQGREQRHHRMSEYTAARTIRDFQRTALGPDLLSAVQMEQMARTGYLTRHDGSTVAVPAEVREAAQAMMADRGALFKKLESATTGTYDGLLGANDFDSALASGRLAEHERRVWGSDEFGAAKTVHDFQKYVLDGELLSAAQMQQIAATGSLTRNDGTVLYVPPDVQQAARLMMADGAALFRQIEAATTGKNDGLLGTNDFDNAVRSGNMFIREMRGPRPTEFAAAKTISDFQTFELGGEVLDEEQMLQMAATGFLTRRDGSTIEVPPEVQRAAARMMEDDGALFDKIECCCDGDQDGELDPSDFWLAVREGVISSRR